MVSVRAMCSILVFGFSVCKCVNQVGLGLFLS